MYSENPHLQKLYTVYVKLQQEQNETPKTYQEWFTEQREWAMWKYPSHYTK